MAIDADLSDDPFGLAPIVVALDPASGTPIPVPDGQPPRGNTLADRPEWRAAVGDVPSDVIMWLSAIADPDAPFAVEFVDDQVSAYESFSVAFERCTGAVLPVPEDLASALPYDGGPDPYWREANGFGLNIVLSNDRRDPRPDISAATPRNECLVDDLSAIYPDLFEFMAQRPEITAGTLLARPNHFVDSPRSLHWANCLSELGIEAQQIGGLVTAAQVAAGISEIEGVESLPADEALELESSLSIADWQCSQDARDDAQQQHFATQQQWLENG